MLTIGVNHQDAESFITAKTDKTKVTGANISVKITDDFMRKVEENSTKEKQLWDKIVHQATTTAEPGVLFWNKIISESPADCYDGFKTISTNPLAN